MMRRLSWPFASVGLLVATLAVVGTVAVRIVAPAPFVQVAFGFGPTVMVAFLAMGVIWAAVGAFLVIRRPENTIGWYVVVVGAGYALAMFCAAIMFAFAAERSAEGLRRAELAAWVTLLCTQVGALAFVIGFVFPTGQAQSPRWATFVRLYWLMLLTFSAIVLFQPGGLHLVPSLQNPFGFGPDLRAGQQISPIIGLFALIVFPAAVLSLVTRYRTSSRIERQQLKWLALAVAVSSVGLGAVFVATLATNGPLDEVGLTLYAVGLAGVPIAIGIAILRHGLYDIDRLITRTLAYGLVLGVLGITFYAVIFVLQAVLAPVTDGQVIAVAASTLLVYVLFQPILRPVRRSVDRRFDRARYDADRTAIAFSGRLRQETDLAAVTSDLTRTTAGALAPSILAVWIREAGR